MASGVTGDAATRSVPEPLANEPVGDTPSAFASSSAVSMPGMVPRSMLPTAVWLTPAARATANTESPRMILVSRSRFAMPAQRKSRLG